MSIQYPDPARRTLISLSTMMATLMVSIDTTIANIALPHIQSTLSAAPEQVVWVVTSYVIATAIGTPLSGWLANRFGRKLVMTGSVILFTIASAACGLAGSLTALVLFRFIQGAVGAALLPLSQATLLDIYPPELFGKAMAIFGVGSMMGGVAGPVLGGWLTETLNWRWVFLINVPVGALAGLAMIFFMDESPTARSRFDMFGFASLSIGLACLQLMIDRGQQLDWFDSPEILIEATIAILASFVFIVHILTIPDPFVRPALFRDRNFVLSAVLAMGLGILIFGALPLFGTMLQQVMGYPVMLAGLIVAPRSIGTAVSMFIAGRLTGKVDGRLLLFTGISVIGLSFYMMSGMATNMDTRLAILSGTVMGIGSGFLSVPLSTMAFTTLPASLRNEGTTLVALFRFVGTSAGISLLQSLTIRNSAIVQSRLSEGIRPDSPTFDLAMPGFDFGMPSAVGTLYSTIARQAMMVAYVDTFWLLSLICVGLLPLTLLMQSRLHTGSARLQPQISD